MRVEVNDPTGEYYTAEQITALTRKILKWLKYPEDKINLISIRVIPEGNFVWRGFAIFGARNIVIYVKGKNRFTSKKEYGIRITLFTKLCALTVALAHEIKHLMTYDEKGYSPETEFWEEDSWKAEKKALWRYRFLPLNILLKIVPGV